MNGYQVPLQFTSQAIENKALSRKCSKLSSAVSGQWSNSGNSNSIQNYQPQGGQSGQSGGGRKSSPSGRCKARDQVMDCPCKNYYFCWCDDRDFLRDHVCYT